MFNDIDQVGIQPDQSCKLSQEVPSGLPLDPEAALQLAQQVALDSCVIAAEERMEAGLAHPATVVWQDGSHTWQEAVPVQS